MIITSLNTMSKNKKNSKDKVNTLNKIQLSVLNSGLIPFEYEAQTAYKLVPKSPIDFNKFNAHIQLLRKYEVLPKIEFHVSPQSFI